MRLLRVAGLLVSLVFGAAQAEAAMPKLQLRPAIPMGYSGDILRLQVKLPCGSKYFGLVARADAKGQVIEVAAAVTDSSVLCTSMPEVVEVGAEFLATRSFKNVSPMAVNAGMRIHAIPVEDVRLAPAGDRSRLQVVYAKRCGRDLGVLIHRHGRDQVEVAMVEDAVSRERAISCLATAKPVKIAAVELPSTLTARPLPERPQSLARQYTLHFAPVQSVSKSSTGLKIMYQRQCNEAPIGVAVGSTSSAMAEVGMLVARFPNVRCPEGLAAVFNETVIESALRVPAHVALRALVLTEGQSVSLRSPSELSLSPRSGGTVLTIGYFETCATAMAVYAHDAQGFLAVGTLALTSGAAATQVSLPSSCNREPSRLSMVQPFLAKSVSSAQVYPLRVRGS